MKENYKVGDKVKVKTFGERPKGWESHGKMDHLMGKVVELTGVRIDGVYAYDDKHEREWFFRFEEFEPVKNECIVIYRKDNKVIALDKLTGEKKEAKCSPDDEFDFYTGAKLAFERLTNKTVKFKAQIAVWCENEEELKTLFDRAALKKYYDLQFPVRIFIKSDSPSAYTFSINKQYRAKYMKFEYVDFFDVDFSECDNEIKVGDIVKIVDTGKMYPTNSEWVKGHVPELSVYYAYGDSAGYHEGVKKLDGKYIVRYIDGDMVYVQSNTLFGKCYLVHVGGLKKC